MLLPNKGKLLALDIGTRRTGVALTDDSQQIAFPREEWSHQTPEELLQRLQDFILEESIVGLLVGLPISMGGESTTQTLKVEDFLKEAAEETALPILTMDERLTTKQSQEQKNRDTGEVNSNAALILLETYLSSKTDMPGKDLP